jgi:hypothetical protein
MLPKSHSCLGRKRLGRPRQVPRHWQAYLRQDLYHMVTGSVLGFPSASLLVVSQLECPVSFFGAASTSAPPYKADPGHFRHCPLWSPFTTRGSVRERVFWPPHLRGRANTIYGPLRLRFTVILSLLDHTSLSSDATRRHSITTTTKL